MRKRVRPTTGRQVSPVLVNAGMPPITFTLLCTITAAAVVRPWQSQAAGRRAAAAEEAEHALADGGASPGGPGDASRARARWDSVLQEYGGDASLVPERALQRLGWGLAGASPAHLRNLSVVDVDTVAALGDAAQALDSAQRAALAEHIVDDWGSKRPEEYSFLDLSALRHLLCGFRLRDLQRLQPAAYKEAAQELAGLKNCSKDILQILANLAVDVRAFGHPSQWTDSQVHSVGCVMGGLPNHLFLSISAEAMEGIMPEAVPCISVEQIKSMSSESFKSLVFGGKSGITSEQVSALTKDKKSILERTDTKNLEENSASSLHIDLKNLLPIFLSLFSRQSLVL